MLALLDRTEPFVADETEATIAKAAVKQLEAVARSGQDVRIVVQDGAKIVVPLPASAVALMFRILESMAERAPISIIPLEAELTTQQAADFLNVSRPFLVGLLEKNEIAYRKVGAHRRVRYADLLDFEKRSRISREDALDEIAREAERLGLD